MPRELLELTTPQKLQLCNQTQPRRTSTGPARFRGQTTAGLANTTVKHRQNLQILDTARHQENDEQRTARSNLQSLSSADIADYVKHRTQSKFGERCFSYAVPAACNSLSHSIKLTTDTDRF